MPIRPSAVSQAAGIQEPIGEDRNGRRPLVVVRPEEVDPEPFELAFGTGGFGVLDSDDIDALRLSYGIGMSGSLR